MDAPPHAAQAIAQMVDQRLNAFSDQVMNQLMARLGSELNIGGDATRRDQVSAGSDNDLSNGAEQPNHCRARGLQGTCFAARKPSGSWYTTHQQEAWRRAHVQPSRTLITGWPSTHVAKPPLMMHSWEHSRAKRRAIASLLTVRFA